MTHDLTWPHGQSGALAYEGHRIEPHQWQRVTFRPGLLLTEVFIIMLTAHVLFSKRLVSLSRAG
jgi:hypothetical protein